METDSGEADAAATAAIAATASSFPCSRLRARPCSIATSRRTDARRTARMRRRIPRNTSAGGARSRRRSATTRTAPATRWGCRARSCIRIRWSSSRCPIGSISTSNGATGCGPSGPMGASCRAPTTSICRAGGDTRRRAGRATPSSSTRRATTNAPGSTTSAIPTAIRWCCTRSTRARTSTRSS